MTMWLKMTLTLMLTLLRPRGSEIARLRFYQPNKEDSKRKKKSLAKDCVCHFVNSVNSEMRCNCSQSR